MASIVTKHPSRSKSFHSSGMAVISLDFSSTATWARTIRFSTAHALTRCKAFFPCTASWERLNVLPSMAMTPGIFPVIPRTQFRKHSSNCLGSIRANTRPKVSCEGMPLGRSKKVLSQVSFVLPNDSISTHPSAPQRTPTIAMRMISSNWCRLVLSTLGSSIPSKMLYRVFILSSIFYPRHQAVLVCILSPPPNLDAIALRTKDIPLLLMLPLAKITGREI